MESRASTSGTRTRLVSAIANASVPVGTQLVFVGVGNNAAEMTQLVGNGRGRGRVAGNGYPTAPSPVQPVPCQPTPAPIFRITPARKTGMPVAASAHSAYRPLDLLSDDFAMQAANRIAVTAHV